MEALKRLKSTLAMATIAYSDVVKFTTVSCLHLGSVAYVFTLLGCNLQSLQKSTFGSFKKA